MDTAPTTAGYNTQAIIAKERARVEKWHRASQVQILWKGKDVERYATAFLVTGLLLHHDGISPFGPDEVPEHYKPEGRGIAGTAVGMLHDGHLIAPFWGTIPDRAIFHGRRTSLSDSRNGAKVFLYTIPAIALVEAWLRDHGQVPPKAKQQNELLLA